jgi:amino acid transporter
MSQSLVRQIGLWSGVAVVIGSTIGSGIFKSPASIATQLNSPFTMLLVWVVGGLVVLCGALTLAEVGSAYPESGGIYVYIREAFGRKWAFLFGWAQLVVIRPSGVGAISLVFGQYALGLTGMSPENPSFPVLSGAIAIFGIVVTTIANIRGVQFGTLIQNLTTVAKVAGLLILIVLALLLGQEREQIVRFQPTQPFQWSAFGLALISVFWAFDGWADGSFVGGEMVDPRKNLPRAILIGTIAVIAIYLLANIGYLSVFGYETIGKSSLIAADTFAKLVGPWGATFISACVMISTFGTLNGSLLTSPRVFYALAEDKLFHPWFAKVHEKFNTPYNSIALCGGLGTAYVVIATLFAGKQAFSSLTDAFVIAMVPFYALSVASVYVFRRNPDYKPETRTPLYPVVPMVFIGVTLVVLINSLIDPNSRIPTVITLGLVAAGLAVWLRVKK